MYHIISFSIVAGLNVYVIKHLSKLDWFNFFNTIHKTTHILLLLISVALFISVIFLYFIFSSFKKTEKKEREKAQLNREKINNNNEILLKSVKNLELLIKNHVINNLTLKEKLSNVLKSIHYNNDFQKNAIFQDVSEKLIDKIADNYTKFKTEKKDLDFLAIEEIEKELKNVISANPNFIVNITYIIELSKTLLNDFARKKSIKPETDSKTIILDYFKILIENMYKSFLDCQNTTKEEIEREYLQMKSIEKTNTQNISGNDNNALTDVKVERDINININNQK